jgi:uncharacterized membrane protein required for colicin V production
MTGLDIAIAITLIISGIAGWRTGVIKVISAALGIGLGVIFASRYGDKLDWLSNFIESDSLVTIAGFCIVFAITLIGAILLANAARKVLGLMLLAWVDSAAGALVGIFTASLVWVAAIGLIGSLPFDGPGKSLEQSKVAELLSNNTSIFLILLPEEYKDIISFIGADYKVPVVSLENSFSKFDENGMNFAGFLKINNPNRFGGNLQSLKYELYTKTKDADLILGSGLSKDIYIKADSITSVEVSMDIEGNIFNHDSLGVRGNAELKFPLSSKSLSIPYDTGMIADWPVK